MNTELTELVATIGAATVIAIVVIGGLGCRCWNRGTLEPSTAESNGESSGVVASEWVPPELLLAQAANASAPTTVFFVLGFPWSPSRGWGGRV